MIDKKILTSAFIIFLSSVCNFANAQDLFTTNTMQLPVPIARRTIPIIDTYSMYYLSDYNTIVSLEKEQMGFRWESVTIDGIEVPLQPVFNGEHIVVFTNYGTIYFISKENGNIDRNIKTSWQFWSDPFLDNEKGIFYFLSRTTNSVLSRKLDLLISEKSSTENLPEVFPIHPKPVIPIDPPTDDFFNSEGQRQQIHTQSISE